MERKSFLRDRLFRALVLTALTVLLYGMSASAAQEVVMTPSGDALIYQGRWTGSDTTVYHRFTASKPALVTVTGLKMIGSTPFGLSVTLCNSAKQPLEKYSSYVNVSSGSAAQYAVLKGTYYIMTTNASTYDLAVSVVSKQGKVSITDPGGKSKKKAKTIKAKKAVYGVIGAGEAAGKTDWYKFKVKKSKVLRFNVEAFGSSSVTFTLYGPSYKKGINISTLKNNSASARSVKTRFGRTIGNLKVKTGTYYIKVNRSSNYRESTYNALYAVRWK